jgi:ATP-dependent Clp protease adapter protein ClpS
MNTMITESLTERLSVRMSPQEKRALRVLAAEDDLNVTDYVLKILRENTALSERAASFANVSTDMHRDSSETVLTPEVA